MTILDSRLFSSPIAHRGLHNEELPENSLGAFENAVKNGFPIELDIQCISDGTVVVFHDYKLSRVTGLDGYVGTLTAERLNEVHLGGTEYTLPTLEQVLETVNGQTPLLIEIKNEGKVGGLEKRAYDMLKGYKGEYAVQSFNPYCLAYFKENAPEVMRGQLSTFFKKEDLSGFFKRYFLKRMKLNKTVSCPDFVSYDINYLPNKYVTKTGLPTLAWTVQSQNQADKAAAVCDNIIFERFIPDSVK